MLGTLQLFRTAQHSILAIGALLTLIPILAAETLSWRMIYGLEALWETANVVAFGQLSVYLLLSCF